VDKARAYISELAVKEARAANKRIRRDRTIAELKSISREPPNTWIRRERTYLSLPPKRRAPSRLEYGESPETRMLKAKMHDS